jgi:hypothetical protein
VTIHRAREKRGRARWIAGEPSGIPRPSATVPVERIRYLNGPRRERTSKKTIPLENKVNDVITLERTDNVNIYSTPYGLIITSIDHHHVITLTKAGSFRGKARYAMEEIPELSVTTIPEVEAARWFIHNGADPAGTMLVKYPEGDGRAATFDEWCSVAQDLMFIPERVSYTVEIKPNGPREEWIMPPNLDDEKLKFATKYLPEFGFYKTAGEWNALSDARKAEEIYTLWRHRSIVIETTTWMRKHKRDLGGRTLYRVVPQHLRRLAAPERYPVWIDTLANWAHLFKMPRWGHRPIKLVSAAEYDAYVEMDARWSAEPVTTAYDTKIGAETRKKLKRELGLRIQDFCERYAAEAQAAEDAYRADAAAKLEEEAAKWEDGRLHWRERAEWSRTKHLDRPTYGAAMATKLRWQAAVLREEGRHTTRGEDRVKDFDLNLLRPEKLTAFERKRIEKSISNGTAEYEARVEAAEAHFERLEKTERKKDKEETVHVDASKPLPLAEAVLIWGPKLGRKIAKLVQVFRSKGVAGAKEWADEDRKRWEGRSEVDEHTSLED